MVNIIIYISLIFLKFRFKKLSLLTGYIFIFIFISNNCIADVLDSQNLSLNHANFIEVNDPSQFNKDTESGNKKNYFGEIKGGNFILKGLVREFYFDKHDFTPYYKNKKIKLIDLSHAKEKKPIELDLISTNKMDLNEALNNKSNLVIEYRNISEHNPINLSLKINARRDEIVKHELDETEISIKDKVVLSSYPITFFEPSEKENKKYNSNFNTSLIPKTIGYSISKLFNFKPDEMWRYKHTSENTTVYQKQFSDDAINVGFIDLYFHENVNIDRINISYSKRASLIKLRSIIEFHNISEYSFTKDEYKVVRLFINSNFENNLNYDDITLEEIFVHVENEKNLITTKNLPKINFYKKGNTYDSDKIIDIKLPSYTKDLGNGNWQFKIDLSKLKKLKTNHPTLKVENIILSLKSDEVSNVEFIVIRAIGNSIKKTLPQYVTDNRNDLIRYDKSIGELGIKSFYIEDSVIEAMIVKSYYNLHNSQEERFTWIGDIPSYDFTTQGLEIKANGTQSLYLDTGLINPNETNKLFINFTNHNNIHKLLIQPSLGTQALKTIIAPLNRAIDLSEIQKPFDKIKISIFGNQQEFKFSFDEFIVFNTKEVSFTELFDIPILYQNKELISIRDILTKCPIAIIDNQNIYLENTSDISYQNINLGNFYSYVHSDGGKFKISSNTTSQIYPSKYVIPEFLVIEQVEIPKELDEMNYSLKPERTISFSSLNKMILILVLILIFGMFNGKLRTFFINCINKNLAHQSLNKNFKKTCSRYIKYISFFCKSVQLSYLIVFVLLSATIIYVMVNGSFENYALTFALVLIGIFISKKLVFRSYNISYRNDLLTDIAIILSLLFVDILLQYWGLSYAILSNSIGTIIYILYLGILFKVNQERLITKLSVKD